MTGAATASFHTTLVAFGNNTGIEVPDSVLAKLDAGRRPPVRVTLNSYEFRTTVGAVKGRVLVPVSKAVPDAADATRKRRIAKAVQLFLDGKQR